MMVEMKELMKASAAGVPELPGMGFRRHLRGGYCGAVALTDCNRPRLIRCSNGACLRGVGFRGFSIACPFAPVLVASCSIDLARSNFMKDWPALDELVSQVWPCSYLLRVRPAGQQPCRRNRPPRRS